MPSNSYYYYYYLVVLGYILHECMYLLTFNQCTSNLTPDWLAAPTTIQSEYLGVSGLRLL